MRHVLLLFAFLISGAISQPIYAYQDTVCHVMTSDSIKLYVHVKGEGPMCLYLHGGPGSGSTWMEAVSGHILEKRFTIGVSSNIGLFHAIIYISSFCGSERR